MSDFRFVRIINTHPTRNYDFHNENKKRILKPGEEAMVPWDLATSLFGDPFTANTSTDQARTRAWDQASGIHNYMTVEGAARELGIPAAEYWDQIKPQVQVYDVESGNRIIMVIEDRDGLLSSDNVPMSNDALNSMAAAQQIATLQRQVELLLAAELQRQQTAVPEGPSELVNTDAAPPTPATDTSAGNAEPLLPGLTPGGDVTSDLPPAPVTSDEPQTPPTGPQAHAVKLPKPTSKK